MTDQVSNEWVQKVEAALLKSQQLPSAEEGFPFPWEHASSALSAALGIKELKISASASAWKTVEELLSGMGKNPVVFHLELAPIAGSVYWVMSSEDIGTVASHCLSSEQKIEGFSDRKLQEGFYNFLALEAAQTIDQLKIFKDTTIRFLETGAAPSEGGLSIDVAITIPNKTVYGRLACSQTFLNNFKAHQPLKTGQLVASEQMKQVEVQLHLEAGSVALSEAEWKGVMPGDFIILDRCSYDPESLKGSVTLMLGNTPLLRGRIKPEGIKVLEYAFYFEDQAPIDMGGTEQIGEGGGENFGEEPLPPEEEQLWAASSAEEEMETAIAPQEASITLTVDVGYIRMTIGKLLELKPDALLDLSVKPEHGIDAAISGKPIGKGELIKLGQLLGIRLLDIER